VDRWVLYSRLAPINSLPPIIAGGGPGTWFLFSYILFLLVGLGGFGSLSTFLYTTEMHESRRLNRLSMQIAFISVTFGTGIACVMLALAGAMGGYALTVNGNSITSAQNLLSPFVYPITITNLITVFGAALTILCMARAKVAIPRGISASCLNSANHP
jgi:hypothetical protein